MKTRVLCCLAALLLLFPALTCAECTHHDEDGRPYGLVPRGYVAPQPGVPGYTGDQCCAVCGGVVIRGSELPPLPEPDNREENQKQEEQIAPAAEPEAPVVSVERPETRPAEQEVPVVPAIPAVQQSEPAGPAEPEAPIVPAAQQEAKPEEKKQETQPQTENKQEMQEQSESKPLNLPAPPPQEKKTEEKQADKPADSEKKPSGRDGKTKKADRIRFSLRFPYRRVKMTPDPDYIAEFAGELLWPLPGSPFLEMFD